MEKEDPIEFPQCGDRPNSYIVNIQITVRNNDPFIGMGQISI